MPNAPSCALSVNPSLDIVNAQQQDPCLSRLLEMKKRGVPKLSIARPDDPIPKIWYNHYNRLFLRDGLLVRSIGDRAKIRGERVINSAWLFQLTKYLSLA